MAKKLKVLITGSRGFIGGHLHDSLKKENIIVEDEPNYGKEGISSNSFHSLDGVNMLIHLASRSFVPESFDNPKKIYSENYLATLSVLEFCRKKNIKKIIFLSSYVYGDPSYLPIDEKHQTLIRNPYGRSKLHCESLCKAYSQDYGIDALILRPFNIYGNGQKKKFLLPTIIEQLLDPHKDQITIENSFPKRDYLYINDLITALKRIILYYEFDGFSIMNIGNGTSHSVIEVIQTVMDVFGIKKEICDKKNARKNEIMDCYADISKIKNKLKWKPEFNLYEGIYDMKNRNKRISFV